MFYGDLRAISVFYTDIQAYSVFRSDTRAVKDSDSLRSKCCANESISLRQCRFRV